MRSDVIPDSFFSLVSLLSCNKTSNDGINIKICSQLRNSENNHNNQVKMNAREMERKKWQQMRALTRIHLNHLSVFICDILIYI